MITEAIEVTTLRGEFESHQRQISMLDRRKGNIWEVCLFAPKDPYLSTQGDYLTFHTAAHYMISPNEQPRLYHWGRPLLGPIHPLYIRYSDLITYENGRPILQVTVGDEAVYRITKANMELGAHVKDFRAYGIVHNFLTPSFLAPLDI